MRSTLKIKTRLLLTVALVTATLAVGSGIALWRVGAVGTEVGRLVREDTRAARAATQLAARVADLGRYERAVMLDVARAHPIDQDLQLWQTAWRQAGEQLRGVDSAEAAGAKPALSRALQAYQTEFERLRARAPIPIDPAAPEAKPT